MIENIISANKQILIFAKDKNLKFLFCNEFFAEVAGLDSPNQVIGKTDYDLVWRKQASIYTNGDITVLKGNVSVNVKEPMSQKTKMATVITSKSVLMDHKGYPSGICGHAIDITGYTVTKNSGYVNPQKNIFYLGENFNHEYFTRREFEVFKYLLIGKHVSEIALILDRSVKTIQAQIKHIAIKLQCTHKSEIVPTAIKYELTDIPHPILKNF